MDAASNQNKQRKGQGSKIADLTTLLIKSCPAVPQKVGYFNNLEKGKQVNQIGTCSGNLGSEIWLYFANEFDV